MKVIVLVKATAASEAGQMPGEELLTAMMQYNQQLVEAGIMLGGEGLHPSSKGARVLFSGKQRTVKTGPFPHTSEIVSGYWLWQVKSMEEAIEWVKRCPNPMLEDSEIEIRPAFGPEDFGEALTPELRERATRFLPGTMVVDQPLVPAPIPVRFPFPGFATNADEGRLDSAEAEHTETELLERIDQR